MKYLPVVALFAIAGVAAFSQLFIGNDAVVMNERVQVDTPEVVEQWMTDEEAVEAAKAVVEKKRLETELMEVQSGIETLQAEYQAALAAMVEKETELEKELGTY